MAANDSRCRSSTIGVFDSGVGGLTVLRALKRRLPNENFVYLGDTARLPYGTKSAESIIRYSLQATRKLMDYNIKCLVVACNTASAAAIDALRTQFPTIPIIGVVEPGAEAGCLSSKSGKIAVVATDSTVRGGAYERAIHALRPEAEIVARACPLFVALAEEGWTSGPIVSAIIHRYLDDIFKSSTPPDTLVLGCTHFPVLIKTLREVLGSAVTIVDSAETTALVLEQVLRASKLERSDPSTGSLRLLATDGQERFTRVGANFLGQAIDPKEVELVDLAAI